MALKDIGTKLYFAIFGPIYRRLSRDVSLKIQDLARVQLEYQERWSAIISDELIALSIRAGETIEVRSDDAKYAPSDIIETVGRIHKSEDLVAISRELAIPLSDLAEMYTKYSDVSASGVVRLLGMELKLAEVEGELQRTRSLLSKYQDALPEQSVDPKQLNLAAVSPLAPTAQ